MWYIYIKIRYEVIKLVILYKCKSMWKKNKYRTGLGMADNYRNVKGGSVV